MLSSIEGVEIARLILPDQKHSIQGTAIWLHFVKN